MAILADDLLLGLKDRGIIPSNQAQLTDTRFLAMADRIIESKIVPLFDSVNKDFFVVYTTTPVVASQSLYATPYRAIGRGLRELKIIDSNNNTRNLPLVTLEESHLYDWQTSPRAFYYIGDQFRLVPDVASSLSEALTLAMWYRCPPNKLCASTSAALVTGVASTSVTVSSVPSNLTIGTSVDFIQGKSGCQIYAMDKTITNISGTTISFAAGDIPSSAPASLASGDWISLAGTSPVVNFIPDQAFSYIESLLARRVLTSIGDETGAKALMPEIKEEKEDLLKIIDPRVQGEPTIIINRSSLMRGNKFSQQRSLVFGS